MKYLTLVLLTLAACAADTAPCTCELSDVMLSNANDAGVVEGPLADVLTYGCSVAGIEPPPLTCEGDTYTAICAGETLHFQVDADCTALLVVE